MLKFHYCFDASQDDISIVPLFWSVELVSLPVKLIHCGSLSFPWYSAGPKDTPMELVFEKTYDAKTGKGMPDL